MELAKKILEEEPSVVIFTSFAEVAKNIHGQLSSNGWEGELLTGETPQKKRQAMVDKFQVQFAVQTIAVHASLDLILCYSY